MRRGPAGVSNGHAQAGWRVGLTCKSWSRSQGGPARGGQQPAGRGVRGMRKPIGDLGMPPTPGRRLGDVEHNSSPHEGGSIPVVHSMRPCSSRCAAQLTVTMPPTGTMTATTSPADLASPAWMWAMVMLEMSAGGQGPQGAGGLAGRRVGHKQGQRCCLRATRAHRMHKLSKWALATSAHGRRISGRKCKINAKN